MLPQILVVLFCSLASVFAVNSQNGCKRQLQSILATSPSCAENYFAELNDKLRKLSPLLFSSQAESVIESFENTYGVTVALTPPVGYQCNVYNINTLATILPPNVPQFFSFNNANGPEGMITSLKVSIDASTSSAQNLRLRLAYGQPNIAAPNSLLFGFICGTTNAGIKATFEDGGLNPANYCTQLNNELTFAPSGGGSIMQGVMANGVTANTPIYLAIGTDTSVTFRSANLTICSTNTVSYDVAKSNLNVNGFRYDAGTYYYTSVYRDQYGQMQYVTISGSESSIIC